MNGPDIDAEKKPYICGHCGKLFSLQGDLSKHNRIHNGVKSYACDHCDKLFSPQGHLTILELILERSHMSVFIVVSHLANRGISGPILELIQERRHMLVATVISHLADRGI